MKKQGPSRSKVSHKVNTTPETAWPLSEGANLRKSFAYKLMLTSCVQVTAALLWLAPFICSGLVTITIFYSLLDPVPLCMVTKIARDAVKASLAYTTSPQATSCAFGVAAVFAASVEVYQCFGSASWLH